MVNWFNHLYPYTNLHELNIDWVIQQIKLNEQEIANFVRGNEIKYADPILWNITSQYEANTVVIDGQTGNAYISTKPVPSGVAISNTEFWSPIFNYEDSINTLREQIAAANEGLSNTATADRTAGDLVWLNDKLAKVIANMIAGDSYVENSNFVYITVEDAIKCTYYPQQEVLKMNAIINGEYDIVAGDVHVYHPGTSTIEITHE